jgi:small subunit ribosomal protein S9
MAQEEETIFSGNYTAAVGRRKLAIARVRLYEGTGNIFINGKKIHDYFPEEKWQSIVTQPLQNIEGKDRTDISIRVSGGGLSGQALAIRLGIARAFVKQDHRWRSTLKKLGLLRRDARRRERKKPGLRSARRAPQWAKR